MRTALVLLVLALILGGCGGPSYSGGPSDEQPHGWVIPGPDVTVWRIDGKDTYSRGGTQLVEPGRRKLRVRIEFPIEDEGSGPPHEYKNIELDVKAGHSYFLERKESEFPPYELKVTERRG